MNPSASNLPPLVYVYKAFPTVSFAWKIGYFIKESYQLPFVQSTLDKRIVFYAIFHLLLGIRFSYFLQNVFYDVYVIEIGKTGL